MKKTRKLGISNQLTTFAYNPTVSYCKWSDENYRSDICCYRDNVGVIVLHVNTHRLKSLPPAIPSIDHTPIDDFIEAYNKHNEFMHTVRRIEIGLAHDGATFRHQYEYELLRTIETLKGAGYRIPSKLLDYLNENVPRQAQA